jgi:hypothetical protein
MPAKEIALTTTCCDCGASKHFSKYEVSRGRHENPRCRPCGLKYYYANRPKKSAEDKRAYLKEYYKQNKAKADAYTNGWRQAKRLELIGVLGGICAACGEKDSDVLDIDHVYDDGAAERKANKRKNIIYQLLAEGVDLSRYQLLCKNCNWRKELARRRRSAGSI